MSQSMDPFMATSRGSGVLDKGILSSLICLCFVWSTFPEIWAVLRMMPILNFIPIVHVFSYLIWLLQMILCFYLEEISLPCQLCLPSFSTSVGFQGFPSAQINLPYNQSVLGLMSFLKFNSLLDLAWVTSLLYIWVFPFYHLD